MKRILTLLIFIGLGSPACILAKDSNFGLGVIVGEPTGISAKLWMSRRTAVDGAVAWSFEKHAGVHLHGDFLVHDYSLIKVSKGRLPLYYGIGGRIKTWEDERDDNVGVRIPVGLEYLFDTAPFDLFVEVVPILDLAPETELNLNAALGARYYF
jgi:hypothetical protein